MQLPILQRILEILRERRDKLLVTTGKTGRGLLKMIISKQLKYFPWLTRHMVNHYIATHPDVQPIGTVVVTNNETVVSGLTDSSPVARATYVVAVVIDLQTPTPTDVSTTATEASDLTSKRGGRPNGSTVGAINAHKLRVAEALDECAIEIASLKCTAAEKSQGRGDGKFCHVPKGAYEKAVSKVCEKCNVKRSEISIKTALSRTKVGRKLKVNHRGPDSPMIGIEAHLLAAILRRAALHQPVYCGEGLELANSMIVGTEAQLALMEWEKINLKNGPNDDSFGTLGPGRQV
jgi:hypothetical protein